MTESLELVLDARSPVAEGSLWDKERQALYWVDLIENKLHRYEPLAGVSRSFPLDRSVGCAVLREVGGMAVALQTGFYAFDELSGRLEELALPANHPAGNVFNDGKCDAAGRFWAGTKSASGVTGAGSVYCLHPDLRVTEMITGVSISNGIGWSPDHSTMYYIDSQTYRIAAYDYDLASGAISNRRICVAFAEEDGLPDGMSVDEEGMLWTAHWGGAKVTRSNPVTGRILETIPVPALFVTSCAFGGPEGDELYITTARAGMTGREPSEYPHAGGLFRMRTGVKGMPTYAFRG